MLEYIINTPDKSKNIPKGTRYFIKVGSVIYTLFACLSIDKMELGVKRRRKIKNRANTPMIIRYSVDSLIKE